MKVIRASSAGEGWRVPYLVWASGRVRQGWCMTTDCEWRTVVVTNGRGTHWWRGPGPVNPSRPGLYVVENLQRSAANLAGTYADLFHQASTQTWGAVKPGVGPNMRSSSLWEGRRRTPSSSTAILDFTRRGAGNL